MSFSLHVVKMPDSVNLVQQQQSFPSGEVTLGRGASNIWVLDDPERFLSSSHCKLSFDGSHYLLTDTSTNGTFLNGSHEPIGKGSTVAVDNGDTFDIGEYSFKLEAGAGGAADSPFDDFSGGFGDGFEKSASPSESANDFFSGSSSDDPFNDSGIHLDDAFSSNNNESATDPLKALDENGGQASDPFSSDPFASTGALPETDFGGFGSSASGGSKAHSSQVSSTFNDGGSPLGQTISVPQGKPAQAIPDNWDDDFDFMSDMSPAIDTAADQIEDPFKGMASSDFPSGDMHIPKDISNEAAVDPQPVMPVMQPPVEPVNTPQPLFDASASPMSTSAEQPLNPGASFQTPRPGRVGSRPQRQPQSTPVSSNGTEQPVFGHANQVSQAPQSPPSQQPLQPPQQAVNTVADTGFISALGLDPATLSQEQQQHINQTAGALMRETTHAMMGLLRSRANIKNEFRMNVTTIQPAENNPLKFSVGVDEALENMFVRKNDAYKDPISAFIEGFEGVAEHQVAIIAGIRFAFENMMEQFNPEQLEKIFNRGKKGAVLSGIQKARNWGMFQDHYKNMTNDMEGAFQQLFGDNFVQAYEDQLRRLKAENKAKSQS